MLLGRGRRLLLRRASTGGQLRAPVLRDIRRVAGVIEKHAAHSESFRPIDLSAAWNTIGKLCRRDATERKWTARSGAAAFEPLEAHTLRMLQHFTARPVANTAQGMVSFASC